MSTILANKRHLLDFSYFGSSLGEELVFFETESEVQPKHSPHIFMKLVEDSKVR